MLEKNQMCMSFIKGLFCVYLGRADRKGEVGLQRLRWLHCIGGHLFTWEALRWERWGQQVRCTRSKMSVPS